MSLFILIASDIIPPVWILKRGMLFESRMLEIDWSGCGFYFFKMRYGLSDIASALDRDAKWEHFGTAMSLFAVHEVIKLSSLKNKNWSEKRRSSSINRKETWRNNLLEKWPVVDMTCTKTDTSTQHLLSPFPPMSYTPPHPVEHYWPNVLKKITNLVGTSRWVDLVVGSIKDGRGRGGGNSCATLAHLQAARSDASNTIFHCNRFILKYNRMFVIAIEVCLWFQPVLPLGSNTETVM